MKFSLLLSCALTASLFAYTDNDMDGVDDTLDRCLGTPFSDLVDAQGCTVRSLYGTHHFDVIAGIGSSQLNYANNVKEETLTTTLQADYYNQNFSAQVIASHFTSDGDSGLNDTLIAGYYQLPISEAVHLKLGVGVLLPTYETGYNNEAADYGASAGVSYQLDGQTALIGGYSYTLVNDTDVSGVLAYQNTRAWYAGANILMNERLSLGGAYHYGDSIYTNVEAIKKLSAYGLYRFDKHWFGNAGYAYGLSDSASDHAFDLRLGYYF